MHTVTAQHRRKVLQKLRLRGTCRVQDLSEELSMPEAQIVVILKSLVTDGRVRKLGRLFGIVWTQREREVEIVKARKYVFDMLTIMPCKIEELKIRTAPVLDEFIDEALGDLINSERVTLNGGVHYHLTKRGDHEAQVISAMGQIVDLLTYTDELPSGLIRANIMGAKDDAKREALSRLESEGKILMQLGEYTLASTAKRKARAEEKAPKKAGPLMAIKNQIRSILAKDKLMALDTLKGILVGTPERINHVIQYMEKHNELSVSVAGICELVVTPAASIAPVVIKGQNNPQEIRSLTQYEVLYLTRYTPIPADRMVEKGKAVFKRRANGKVVVFFPKDATIETIARGMADMMTQDRRNNVDLPKFFTTEGGQYMIESGAYILDHVSFEVDDRGLPCEINERLPE